jgi:glycosyltransferase involved in cell wall biosynthesis
MNVLIIAQYFPPDLGGSATRAYNVAKGLTINGCNVTVVSAFPHYPHGNIPPEYRWKPFKVEWIGKIRVIRTFILPLKSEGLSRRILLFTCFIFTSLFAIPLVGKVDVIWAANPDVVAMVPALAYGLIKRRPVTTNVDDLAIEDLYDLNLIKKRSVSASIIELIAKFLYNKMKAITPISPGYVSPLIEKYGVNRKRIHVVYGGVDLNIFKPKTTEQNNPRKDEFIVLYSGAFSIAYDFNQVLNAAKILEEKDGKVKFILQGKGELVDQIKLKINQLGLRNVVVIDKLLSREEVAELLNKADMLIQPLGDYGKPHMGVSTKLYEYQAVGKPIICCSAGQPAKYVKETRSGVVVKPGDYEALAKAIIWLKENPKLALEMGENGRRYVEKEASIEAIGSKMKQILQALIAKHGKSTR